MPADTIVAIMFGILNTFLTVTALWHANKIIRQGMATPGSSVV